MVETESLFAMVAAGQIEELTSALDSSPDLAAATNAQGISLLLWAKYHRRQACAETIYTGINDPSANEAVAMNDVAALSNWLRRDSTLLQQFSSDGFTLLHYACFFAHPDCVSLLLEQGAEVNCCAQNSTKVYPLHSAAAAQAVPIASQLLAKGANVNVQQAGGFTALMAAALHNNDELINLLCGYGADLNLRDDEGKSAYDHGLEKGFDIEKLAV